MTAPAVPPARVVFSDADRREILELVDSALASGTLTLGPLTERLERSFAARHAATHAVATSSGTSALEIILRAVGVAGNEVLVPANTFYATAGAAVHAGATPRFADVDATTLALSRATVEAALTPSVVAVVHVHIGGLISPAVEEIRSLCNERQLVLVEDAAHAHGSSLMGLPAGSWSRAAGFSFYPTKVLASAEGGIVVTEEEWIRDEARIYRDQGKASFLGGGHVRMGSAWRMSEVQAAIALVHLRRLDDFIERRRAVAERYTRALSECDGIEVVAEPPGCRSNFYKYPVLLAPGIDRGVFKAALREGYGVHASGEVYAIPLHREPVFADYARDRLPVAEDVCARQICLPIHSDMTATEADRVVDAVTAVLARQARP